MSGEGRFDLPAIANRTERDNYGFASMTAEALVNLWNMDLAPKWDAGECVCPVFENGARGFRQKCPVHGGRSREDFARLTALRCEIALRLRVPSPAGGVIGGKERSK